MKLRVIATAFAMTASITAFAKSSVYPQVQQEYQKSGSPYFVTDHDFSYQMLNKQEITGGAVKILNARQSKEIAPNSINIGGKGEMYAVYQKINGKSRSAICANSDDYSSTTINFPVFDLSFTGTLGDWTSAYANLRASDVSTSDIKLPHVYFVIGNLDKAPVYVLAGKKTVEFGNFNSMNNFIPTLTRAYFMAYGAQASIGYTRNDVNAVFTVMNGNGKYLLNSKASSANQLNNFSLSTDYKNNIYNIFYRIGAGYVNATGFSRNTDATINPRSMVGAVDLNATIKSNGVTLNGELLVTTQGVRGMNDASVYYNADADQLNSKKAVSGDTAGYKAFSFNALPALVNFDSGSTVKAWSLDSSYTIPLLSKDMSLYISYSHIVQNSDNNLYQVEIGSRCNPVDVVWIGGSYNYTSGKNSGSNVGKFSTVMLNASVYF
jgi:hypothetical protein